jgi:HK97 family phage prohead protease
MNIQRKNIGLKDIELKFASNGGFSGYASVFDGLDSYGDTIEKGAYRGVIEQIQRGGMNMPKMFVNHKSWEIPVGKYIHIEEDEKGLYMEGEFTKGNPDADKVKAAMEHGTVDGLSIGFMIGDYEMINEDNQTRRIIKSIKELPEVSIVTYPADENARVDLTSVKSVLDNIATVRDFEKFLRDVAGFSNNLARETAKSARVLFSQMEFEEADVMPSQKNQTDIQRQIAIMLLNSRTL